MRTPKEFTFNLKNRTITMVMLDEALFSVNKRAKNWRDKKREYRTWKYDTYDNEAKAEAQEQKMYEKKEILLSVLKPNCIHQELLGYDKIRVHSDTEEHYAELLEYHKKNGTFVYTGKYMDWDYHEEVEFFDYIDHENPDYQYYLYYEMPKHSYHTPIDEDKANEYTEKYGLPVIEIDKLHTSGKAVDEIMSMQFVDKVVALIESGEYQLEDALTVMSA